MVDSAETECGVDHGYHQGSEDAMGFKMFSLMKTNHFKKQKGRGYNSTVASVIFQTLFSLLNRKINLIKPGKVNKVITSKGTAHLLLMRGSCCFLVG